MAEQHQWPDWDRDAVFAAVGPDRWGGLTVGERDRLVGDVLTAAVPHVRDEAAQAVLLGAAVDLLKYALHLRTNGERAPGGNETWAEWDSGAETFLRSLQEGGERDARRHP